MPFFCVGLVEPMEDRWNGGIRARQQRLYASLDHRSDTLMGQRISPWPGLERLHPYIAVNRARCTLIDFYAGHLGGEVRPFGRRKAEHGSKYYERDRHRFYGC